ncbi:MAG TPA: hypothetical protein VHV28_00390, partial [Solirubrobacteraceae bacterium]|nr:hypothetical protein [Solirubrobacteraceae bacterium]
MRRQVFRQPPLLHRRRNDPYTNFIADNKRLNRELTAAGIPHAFRLYPGAHNGTFWRMHQDQWLDTAVDRLDPPTRSQLCG